MQTSSRPRLQHHDHPIVWLLAIFSLHLLKGFNKLFSFVAGFEIPSPLFRLDRIEMPKIDLSDFVLSKQSLEVTITGKSDTAAASPTTHALSAVIPLLGPQVCTDINVMGQPSRECIDYAMRELCVAPGAALCATSGGVLCPPQVCPHYHTTYGLSRHEPKAVVVTFVTKFFVRLGLILLQQVPRFVTWKINLIPEVRATGLKFDAWVSADRRFMTVEMVNSYFMRALIRAFKGEVSTAADMVAEQEQEVPAAPHLPPLPPCHDPLHRRSPHRLDISPLYRSSPNRSTLSEAGPAKKALVAPRRPSISLSVPLPRGRGPLRGPLWRSSLRPSAAACTALHWTWHRRTSGH